MSAKISVSLLMKVAVCVASLLCVSWFVLPKPLGSGDDARIAEYTRLLKTMTANELRHQLGSAYVEIPLPDAVITGIIDDSHASMWGGNIVVLCPDGSIRSWKCHVCGRGHMQREYRGYMASAQNAGLTLTSAGFIEYLNNSASRAQGRH